MTGTLYCVSYYITKGGQKPIALQVHRRKGESFDSLLRRFSRRTQQSGLMLEVRKRRCFTKKLNERKRRDSKLYRMEKSEEIEQQRREGVVIEKKKPGRR